MESRREVVPVGAPAEEGRVTARGVETAFITPLLGCPAVGKARDAEEPTLSIVWTWIALEKR